MQTISFLLFRLQESGLGSQDILSKKPWKLKKNMLESFLHEGGKRQHMVFCINHPFRAIWSRFFFSIPDTLRIRILMKIFARIRKKNTLDQEKTFVD